MFSAGCASKTDVKPVEPDGHLDASQPNRVTGIRTIEDSGSISVLIQGTRLLTYTSVKQPSPPAVLLYFPETALDDTLGGYRVASDIIREINAREINVGGITTRIEIALAEDISYQAVREGTGLKISFQKGATVPSAAKTLEVAPESDTRDAGRDIGHTAETDDTMAMQAEATQLHSIVATPLDSSVKIEIEADGTITGFRSFPVYNPARIVFDLYNVSSPYRKEQALPVNTKWVKQIRHYQYPDRTRVVLDTTATYASSFSASPVETGLVIHVGSGATPVPAKRESPAKPARNEPTPVAAGGIQPELPSSVSRVDFVSEPDGRSSIVIGTTRPVQYEVRRAAANRLLLQLFRTTLPGYRQRPLITTRFESAVDRISPVQTPEMGDTAHFVIELREAVPYFVEQSDRVLQIRFEASSVPPQTMAQAELPAWERVLAQSSETPASTEPQPETDTSSPLGPVKKYSGERIALDFFETDIKNVFRILQKVSGKNFAIDKDVEGKVTLTLDKPVPWDQVLDLILRMNQLGKVAEGDIIRVATVETLKKEDEDRRTELTEEQKAREEQKAVEPLMTEYIIVSYANARSEVMPHIEKILTPDRGSISVDDRSNLIIYTDVAAKIEEVKHLVHRLDRPTDQVIIQARVVEASTSFSREIGTEWTATGGIQPPDANAGIGPQRGYDSLGGTYGWDAAVNFPGTMDQNSSRAFGFNFTRIAGSPLLLTARLRAMESEGRGKIVSAPKIVTLDNKTATIKQGLEYPYLERDKEGNATRSFKNIDLSLEVTPHVTGDKRISMDLTITKNDIGEIINNEQSFTTKEARTELLVDDGETIVIGGIIKTSDASAESGLPGFAKIPVLGWLFKTESDRNRKEELLIFITPKIVQLEQRDM